MQGLAGEWTRPGGELGRHSVPTNEPQRSRELAFTRAFSATTSRQLSRSRTSQPGGSAIRAPIWSESKASVIPARASPGREMPSF